MGAQIREYRNRIRAVSSTKKITRAMELMAASRVVKAQQAVRESSPYARALTRAVSAVATFSNEDHPLTSEKEDVKRAAVVIMTSDRGLAGAYSSSAIKESERLTIEAVRHRSYDYALQALAVNPLVSSVGAARRFLDRVVKDESIKLH